MSAEQQDFIAKRIGHYLIGYRRRHNLTQDGLARKLKLTKSSICRFEKAGQNSLVNSLETVCDLASLENKSAVNFIAYLLKEEIPTSSDHAPPWQQTLITTFKTLDQLLRFRICSELLPKLNSQPSRLNLMFECMLEIGKLNEEQMKAARDFLRLLK